MTDETIELTRRKILGSIGAVGVAGAGAAMGTSAYFSDEESFDGNTLAAGELDLKIDWQQTYSGPIPGSGGDVGVHPVNAYPDSDGDGVQDLEGVTYSGAGEVDPVFDAADVPACCDCAEDEYYLAYGGETYCVTAIDGGETSVADFYEYADFASQNDDLTRKDTAVLFLYENDAGLHLGVVKNDDDDSRTSTEGYFSGITVEGVEDGEWINVDWVEDDDRDGPARDVYETDDGVAKADWAWQQQKTDGGVLGQIDEDFALRVTPRLNNEDETPIDDGFSEVKSLTTLAVVDGGTGGDGSLSSAQMIELASDDNGLDTDIGSITIHSACGIESGEELDTPDVFQSDLYDNQNSLIELDDVKPGDRGEVTFSVHLCDNPGYVWLTASNFEQSGGALTEPEQVAINESNDSIDSPSDVTSSDDPGELADEMRVRVWYDGDCDNGYDDDEALIFDEVSLTEFVEAMDEPEEDDLPFDRFRLLDSSENSSNSSSIDDAECFDPEQGFCIGFEWWLPAEVGNVVQGDTVSFDLGFYTEQCRHNGE